MSILLAGLIVLGVWFAIEEDIKDRRHHLPDSNQQLRVKVYAPVERDDRCRRIAAEPVFRDLDPPRRP